MTITASALAALAITDACAALSRSPSVQAWLAVAGADAAAKAAAALLLIFKGDTGSSLPARYLVVTCRPRPPERQAADLVRHVFDIHAECCMPQPSGATDSQQDFIAGHNLGDVSKDLVAEHDAGTLDFELVDGAVTDIPYRTDDNNDRRGDILNVIDFALEGWE